MGQELGTDRDVRLPVTPISRQHVSAIVQELGTDRDIPHLLDLDNMTTWSSG